MERKHYLRKAGILCLLLALCLTVLPITALADSFQAVVTSASMVVRSGPTVDDPRIGTLKKGTTVTVLNHKNGIAFIEYKGKRVCPPIRERRTRACRVWARSPRPR